MLRTFGSRSLRFQRRLAVGDIRRMEPFIFEENKQSEYMCDNKECKNELFMPAPTVSIGTHLLGVNENYCCSCAREAIRKFAVSYPQFRAAVESDPHLCPFVSKPDHDQRHIRYQIAFRDLNNAQQYLISELNQRHKDELEALVDLQKIAMNNLKSEHGFKYSV